MKGYVYALMATGPHGAPPAVPVPGTSMSRRMVMRTHDDQRVVFPACDARGCAEAVSWDERFCSGCRRLVLDHLARTGSLLTSMSLVRADNDYRGRTWPRGLDLLRVRRAIQAERKHQAKAAKAAGENRRKP